MMTRLNYWTNCINSFTNNTDAYSNKKGRTLSNAACMFAPDLKLFFKMDLESHT